LSVSIMSSRRGPHFVFQSTEELVKKIKERVEAVEEATEGKLRGKDASWTRVLLVGVTGGGKTTLLHALIGRKLVAKENDETGILYYDALEPLSDGDQQFTIGNGTESETYIPNVWVDSNNKIIYVDCPGFLDTETDRRLINAFSMDKVLSNAEATGAKVKVLFVVSENQLSEKGLTARQGLILISKMFPNIDQLKRAVGVVVTKTSPRAKPVGLLKKLQEGKADSALLDKFISDGDQRVFSFPSPSPYDPVGIPTDPLPVEVKKRIFSFLESDRVSGLKHELAIESDAEKLVIKLGYWFIDDKVKAINLLATEIEHAMPAEMKDQGAIHEWESRVQEIQDASKTINDADSGGWKAFSEFCKDLAKEVSMSKEVTQDMEKLVPVEDFINKVSKASSDAAADLKEKSKALIDNALSRFQIIKGNLNNKKALMEGKVNQEGFQKKLLELQDSVSKMKKEREQLQRDLDEARNRGDPDDSWCTLL